MCNGDVCGQCSSSFSIAWPIYSQIDAVSSSGVVAPCLLLQYYSMYSVSLVYEFLPRLSELEKYRLVSNVTFMDANCTSASTIRVDF